MNKKNNRNAQLIEDLISRGYTDVTKMDLLTQDDIYYMLKHNYKQKKEVKILIDRNGDYQFIFGNSKRIRIPKLKITHSMEYKLTKLFENGLV